MMLSENTVVCRGSRSRPSSLQLPLVALVALVARRHCHLPRVSVGAQTHLQLPHPLGLSSEAVLQAEH